MCSGDTLIGKALGTATHASTAINQKIQDFSNTMTSEAKTVFGNADTVFNNMIGQVQQIFSGGPSQMGWSQNQMSAANAAAVEGGATMARNLKGAAITAAPGGGNMPGSDAQTAARIQQGNIAASEAEAKQLNENVQANYEQGNKNWQTAGALEEKLPSVYAESGASTMNANAAKELNTAQQSQKALDTQNNWEGGLVKSGLAVAGDLATGGLSGIASGIGNLDFTGGSSLGENIGNFWSGAITGKGSMPNSTPPGNMDLSGGN